MSMGIDMVRERMGHMSALSDTRLASVEKNRKYNGLVKLLGQISIIESRLGDMDYVGWYAVRYFVKVSNVGKGIKKGIRITYGENISYCDMVRWTSTAHT